MTDNEALNMVDTAIKSDFIGKCNVGYDLAEALGIVVRIATNAIKNREADRWIPVSERLPDTNDNVLVYDGSDMFVAWYENEGMSEGWHSFDIAFGELSPIIAWRPLPKPYESEAV